MRIQELLLQKKKQKKNKQNKNKEKKRKKMKELQIFEAVTFEKEERSFLNILSKYLLGDMELKVISIYLI